jgi:hypothetical protein
LIDQHPAGWSVLQGDFTTPPGYRLPTDPADLRNQCYCHGDRHDPPRTPLDDHTACDAWVDYRAPALSRYARLGGNDQIA